MYWEADEKWANRSRVLDIRGSKVKLRVVDRAWKGPKVNFAPKADLMSLSEARRS